MAALHCPARLDIPHDPVQRNRAKASTPASMASVWQSADVWRLKGAQLALQKTIAESLQLLSTPDGVSADFVGLS